MVAGDQVPLSRSDLARDRPSGRPSSRQRVESAAARVHRGPGVEPPHHLDDRVDFYRERLASGARPAALGISVLDVRSPAVTPWDKDEKAFDHAEHWCLATYLVDGHHKVQAAARSGRSLPLLLFVSRGASIASEQDVDAVVRLLDNGR